jgi:hypothetical protein
MHLRQLVEGVRFILCRTGQRFRMVRREPNKKNKTIYVVQLEGSARESSLHHSCRVKPILTPTNMRPKHD